MASQFFRFSRSPLLLTIPLCGSLTVLHSRFSSPVRCEFATSGALHPSIADVTLPRPSSQQEKHAQSSLINARNVRQISMGSALGILVGLGLRIFSKTLTFTLGAGILLIEWAASRGYNIVPPGWVQNRLKSIDFRRLTSENIVFKASFGTTLALSAFSEF
ncbi:hypothetical protein FQN57_005262 [Myotisia sp. PD_48]|nr:hypothetical protein FQN57_005262 [Myotisia sp. PD_48]